MFGTRCCASPFNRTPGSDSKADSNLSRRAASTRPRPPPNSCNADFRRFAQADNSRNILRARAAVAFVMAAMENRLEFRAGANVQRTHALRPINFVRGNRKQIHAEAVHVQTAICPQPAPRRSESKYRASVAMRPISSIGWIVPSSLFASITLMSAVSGRMASRTSSGSTMPVSAYRNVRYSPRPAFRAPAQNSEPRDVRWP